MREHLLLAFWPPSLALRLLLRSRLPTVAITIDVNPF